MKNTERLSLVLQNELQSAPVIEEFLLSGVANISAVASALQPLVTAKLGRKFTLPAIGMALRRYKVRMKRATPLKKKFPRRIEVRAIDSLVELAYRKDEKAIAALSKLTSKLMNSKSRILVPAFGAYEIVILADRTNLPKIQSAMKGFKKTAMVKEAACVTVDWPAITKDIPGIYYRITRALARREIPIQSFHTIGAEMMIVVKAKDLTNASNTINQLLSNQEFQ